MNVQKAAEFLDVNPYTIRKWAQQGKVEAVKIGTRGDWRFTKDNLLKLTTNNHINLLSKKHNL